ncbi:peroxynitrite isomerase THAP4-like [Dermacentor silvarum]|uniref:peroxynitrite isomerase THAP4-like n=1 Tax=Dermacentor silvarum TaxID=543639 RepID=UPI00210134CF|nr:peroxynitrite isomerase THAP4-like [Dermacentor silvarum]
MVVSCCAVGCTKRAAKGSGVGFFRFPKENTRRKAWVQAVRREKWQPSDSSRICGLHFITGAPSPFPNHPDWAPNVFAFKKANREAEEKKCDRYERTLKRKRCSASNHGSAAHTRCVVAAYAAYASRDKANAEAESDGDAVASTLFLGDIEPDPTESDGDAVASTLFLGDIEPDPTESDGDAVASTLFLGDIEPDPTDGDNKMEPDSTDDEASNDLPESMQLLQAQLPAPSHHMGGFSRNLQTRMQEKYLEKCRAYNALQERYLIMENELRDLRAKRSSEANGAAAAWDVVLVPAVICCISRFGPCLASKAVV